MEAQRAIPFKVYLVKFNRETSFPKCVYKVGITSHKDVEERFKNLQDSNAVMNHFEKMKVMHSIWVDNEDLALVLEAHILSTIRDLTDSPRFHNWHEPVQLDGITEMRKWNYDEFLTVIDIMNEWKNRKALLEVKELHKQTI